MRSERSDSVARLPRALLSLTLLFSSVLAAQELPPASTVLHLSLDEAVERAREASPRLRELAALRAAAAAEEERARAARRPDVDAAASYRRQSDVPEFSLRQPDGSLRTLFPNIPNNYASRVSFGVPLYTGGSLSAGVDAAAERRLAAEHDVDAGVGDLVLEVTAAYWELVVAGERRRVVAEGLTAFNAHLEDARNRRRFGLAPESEVLAVQVERDRAELSRLEAERDRAVAEADLERLLDLPPATAIAPADAPPPPALPEGSPGWDAQVEAWVERALASRPERAALSSRLVAAEAAVAVARGTLRPQVRASAGYEVARPNPRILPPEDEFNDSWDVTLQATYNLFDGGKRRADVARAEAQAEVWRERLLDLDRRLRLEVTTRALDLATARAAATVAESAVVAAQESSRVSGDRFREGLIPSSERLDAEVALLRAGLDLASARARLQVAAAALERAVGGALDGNGAEEAGAER